MTREQLNMLDTTGVKTGIYPKGSPLPEGSKLTTETEAIDSMTINIVFVAVIYLATFLFLKLLTFLLAFAGDLGNQLAVNLWGLSFIFAAIMAIAAKGIIKVLKVDHVLDNGSLTRISGMSVDLMVAGAIGAISLVVVSQYWLPIVIMCAVGGIVTIVTVPWICSRLFRDHKFHRTLIVYGACTGTMPTGLALLRVIDPEFATPAASDYMFSSGITFVLAIPFILAINLPAYARTTGNMAFFWAAVGVSGAYLLVVIILYAILSRKRAIARPSSIWLKPSKRAQED
jgi:ESS family glutamate:Na+ symporter